MGPETRHFFLYFSPPPGAVTIFSLILLNESKHYTRSLSKWRNITQFRWSYYSGRLTIRENSALMKLVWYFRFPSFSWKYEKHYLQLFVEKDTKWLFNLLYNASQKKESTLLHTYVLNEFFTFTTKNFWKNFYKNL